MKVLESVSRTITGPSNSIVPNLRIAYFVNHYPKVSHSFIRREILALERHGFEVTRLALRGWNDSLPDVMDTREQERTHYVLRNGVRGYYGRC